MTDDVVTFGVIYYLGRYIFIAFFALIAIIVAYPWILLIVFFLWLALSSSSESDVALRVDSEPEGTPRYNFLKEQERQRQLAAQEAGEG